MPATMLMGLSFPVASSLYLGDVGRLGQRLPEAVDALVEAADADRGLLVSEFPPGTPARPHHFPRRNRIMAGLARAVVFNPPCVLYDEPTSGLDPVVTALVVVLAPKRN